MLDPFTALSLASSIFQFAELGYKVTNRALEIWNNEGETRDIKLYDSTVQDFNGLVRRLDDPLPQYQQTDAEKRIAELAKKCKEDVDDLRKLLQGLKPEKSEKPTAVKSLLFSMKIQWREKEISELHKRFEGYRAAISFNLLDLLKYELPDNPCRKYALTFAIKLQHHRAPQYLDRVKGRNNRKA